MRTCIRRYRNSFNRRTHANRPESNANDSPLYLSSHRNILSSCIWNIFVFIILRMNITRRLLMRTTHTCANGFRSYDIPLLLLLFLMHEMNIHRIFIVYSSSFSFIRIKHFWYGLIEIIEIKQWEFGEGERIFHLIKRNERIVRIFHFDFILLFSLSLSRFLPLSFALSRFFFRSPWLSVHSCKFTDPARRWH